MNLRPELPHEVDELVECAAPLEVSPALEAAA